MKDETSTAPAGSGSTQTEGNEAERDRAAETLSGFAKIASVVTAFIVGIALVLAPIGLAGAGVFASVAGLSALHGSIFHLGTGPVGIGNAKVETGANGASVVKVNEAPSDESVARAGVTAAAVVGTLVLLVVVVIVLSLRKKRRTLLIAGLMLIVWLAISVILAMVDTWLSVGSLTVEANLLTTGQFLYAALPALPVIPLIWLVSSASHEPEEKYQTMAAAAGDLLKAILKSVLTVAMWLIEFFFGVTIGVNPLAALFVGGVNALTFSKALGEAEKARHEGDRQGVHIWGAVAVFYALLAFTISAEAIITFSSDPTTGQTRLTALHASPELQSIAQWVYVSSLGLSFLLLALMEWRKQGYLAGKGPAKPARPVANVGGGFSIRQTRDALRSGGSKARGVVGRIGDLFKPSAKPAELPRPQGVSMANEGTPETQIAEPAPQVAPEIDRAARSQKTLESLDNSTSGTDPKTNRRRRTQ